MLIQAYKNYVKYLLNILTLLCYAVYVAIFGKAMVHMMRSIKIKALFYLCYYSFNQFNVKLFAIYHVSLKIIPSLIF